MRRWLFVLLWGTLFLVVQADVRKPRFPQTFRHEWYASLAATVADGDIIFRRGSSMASRVVLMSDKRSDYSHTGIVRVRDSLLTVIHAVPGERHDKAAAVKHESLARFTQPSLASKVAVARVKNTEKACRQQASAKAYSYYCRHVPFDQAFDLRDTAALYCTELIWQAYRHAGLDLVDSRFDVLNTLFKPTGFILPSSLFYSPYVEIIAEYP